MNAILLFLMLAGDPANCPMHAQHTAAATATHNDVDRRGDKVMGFSHEKTKHTFRMLRDGGAIEVRANDAADAESIASIRAHMREIAKEFTAGTFTKPEEIHARMPDGVDVIRELGSAVAFRYEELDRGARVRVRTENARGREAVHAFLRFQIKDHRTGDAAVVDSE